MLQKNAPNFSPANTLNRSDFNTEKTIEILAGTVAETAVVMVAVTTVVTMSADHSDNDQPYQGLGTN